jgi:hypothetical protein
MTSTNDVLSEEEVWFLICSFISQSKTETQAVLPHLENALRSIHLLDERTGMSLPILPHNLLPEVLCSTVSHTIRQLCFVHSILGCGNNSDNSLARAALYLESVNDLNVQTYLYFLRCKCSERIRAG